MHNAQRALSHRDRIAQIISGLAIYYGIKLIPEQLDMFIEDLLDLSPDELTRAVYAYRNDPESRFFPRPAQLKALLKPSDDVQARDVAARIATALGRFGGRDNLEKAKAFIGELGWQVVRMQGGWEELSSIPSMSELVNRQAQWRELAKSVTVRHKLGIQAEAPRLPGKTTGPQLVSFSNLLDHAKKHIEQN